MIDILGITLRKAKASGQKLLLKWGRGSKTWGPFQLRASTLRKGTKESVLENDFASMTYGHHQQGCHGDRRSFVS